MMGGIQSRIMMMPFSFHFIDTYALTETAMTCEIPTGTLKSIVSKGSETNELIMRGPKVEMPLEGTEMQKIIATQSHVLTSRSVS